ncbi:MAG: tetraacyldisaccharide 4'-kinase [Sulfurovaceae bacterium]|nr:tetraacyldisaccharide 4'-kinase [Sulfurovaceae bacterium]
MTKFFETIWFKTKWYHWFIVAVLLPFGLLWGTVMSIRRALAVQKDYGLPIVSIGNLIVGGTGKTPFIIELASQFDGVFVISRGYGRQSKGLMEVSRNGNVQASVNESGDEAMLIAKSLPNISVIVSENRKAGIAYAKDKGAKVIFLDDGFNQVGIKKFDIILEPSRIANYLPFPAGPFREFWLYSKKADLVVKEDIDFTRYVTYENLKPNMILVTAIANPTRLDKFLPKGIIDKYYFDDHAYFDEEKLGLLLYKNNATSLLVTEKDAVKMDNFKLPISKIKLKLELQKSVIAKVDSYIKGYRA